MLSPAPQPAQRTQSPWKAVFRLPNASSKRLAVPPSPSLPSSAASSIITAPSTASLAPGPYHDPLRSSYHSSSTQSSTESQFGQPSTPHYSTPPRQRQYTRSERSRPNIPRLAPTPPSPHLPTLHTPEPSQSAFAPPPQRSRTNNGPLSPRSVGATASRFIRRVASAPNAKGLFSMGSRSTATTKNGLLAPAESVPPMPSLVSSSSDQGQESSLETVSSGSSRGRMSRPLAPAPLNPSTVASQHGLPPVPPKIAFRRTYSSNSIKVRQVGSTIAFYNAPCLSGLRWRLARRVSQRSRC